MPKLTPAQQASRKQHILVAAEQCFVGTGFHGTSMQAICRRANVSAGALYLYFDSKEALIEGIVEGERERVLANFAGMRNASDFMSGMDQLNRNCVAQMSEGKTALFLEVVAEAVRNPAIARILQRVDEGIRSAMRDMFTRALAEGRIASAIPVELLVSMVAVMFDGLLLRRSIDPNLDTQAITNLTMQTIRALTQDGPTAPATGVIDIHLEPV